MKRNQPENINRLLENKFLVTFDRIPTTTYFCDQVTRPGIYTDNPIYPTQGKNIPLAGSKMEAEEFVMRFKVDEDVLSWEEIYNWIRGYSTPSTHKEYVNMKKKVNTEGRLPAYSDAVVSILTNTNHPNIRVIYKDIFPVKLSSLQFDSTTGNSSELLATAHFRYSDFTIMRG